MAGGDSIPLSRTRPPSALTPTAPWIVGAAALSLAQWSTLPLAAWSLGRTAHWWLPLAAGAMLRQAAVPAWRALTAARVRPAVLRLLADRALASSRFEHEPSSLGPLAQRLEHGLSTALPALAASALTTAAFALLAARAFPWPWTVGTLVAALGAWALRTRTRPLLDASSDALLDALRAEGAWLHAAARGRWEITGSARDHFLSAADAHAARVVSAERTHQGRARALRAAQLALFLAPLAWVLTAQARRGVPVTARDWALVVPALAPLLAALGALDDLALARRALARVPDESPSAARSDRSPEGPLVLGGVGARYGDHVALRDVTFTVPATGVLAVVGPNGAGKSTLARIVAGAHTPDAGSASVQGVSMTDVAPERVAFVPQHPCFVESLTVLDNVRLAAPDVTPERCAAMLSSLGLTVSPAHPASGLSRGEQRRIAVARALLRGARWIVLDEPDAWLDHDGREALQRALREASQTAAVVLVTHRADLVAWADRVVVLSAAHTVEAEGAPAETLAASETGRALLASLADESLRFSAR